MSNPTVEKFRAENKSFGSVTTTGGTTLEVFAGEQDMVKFLLTGKVIDCWFELYGVDAYKLCSMIEEAICEA